MKASGPAEKIATLPGGGGHWTRDLAFSPDGKTLFVSVGSATNVDEGAPRPDQASIAKAPIGASFGDERRRADVLAFDPDGGHERVYATGIRNCSGLAVQPGTGALWCAVNERDGLGDDLPPDYATHVAQGAFYGWPWYYLGDHQDPRHKGERADLANAVTMPDVLIQAHSAPLGIAFYAADQFPSEYKGDAFVTLHGSWNRSKRTGYKVVRLVMKDGKPTGVYEDFLVGFVDGDRNVWGRPVGVAVTHDGSLLVSDDGSGSIWRVSYKGEVRLRSARKRTLDAEPDREQAIVVASRRKELDAGWQACGVRSGRQRQAAHPQQVAEKRVVDGAQVGDAEQFVVAFKRTKRRRRHGRRRQHQQRSLQLVDQGRDQFLAAALQVGRVTLADPARPWLASPRVDPCAWRRRTQRSRDVRHRPRSRRGSRTGRRARALRRSRGLAST